jgi:SAM-dependent methyltransferase
MSERNRSDDARIAAYYDNLVDAYGHDPRAVDASSRTSLELRYDALAAVTDLTGASVLEVGCGLGDLGAYLLERFDGITYRGIDVSPRMVEEGARAHPGLDLRQANVLDQPDAEGADVVLAQGIFYLLGDDAEAKTRAIVTRMFELAGQAVALTAISAWTPEPDPGEYYMDPGFALELGRSLTRAVVLRHDYHPGDLTMYLYRRDWA